MLISLTRHSLLLGLGEGFLLSRKFYVRVHACKFYSRKQNRDEVWAEVLRLKREVKLDSTFTRAIFQTLPLFYLRTEILRSYDVKITRQMKSTSHFGKEISFFQEFLLKTISLLFRIWLVWLDSLD